MDIVIMGAFLFLSAWIAAEPFLQQSEKKWSEVLAEDNLGEEKEKILQEIRELVFDFAAGKIEEREYEVTKAQLVRKLKEVSGKDVRS
ncbi:MAG: hypothetical protein V2G48_00715 [bacterium JZ-2024 1]